MNFRLVTFLALLLVTFTGAAASAPALRVTNHHPFAIRETIPFPLPSSLANAEGSILAVSHSVTGGTVEAHYLPIQVDPGTEEGEHMAWIDVQMRSDESRTYTFQEMGGRGQEKEPATIEKTFPNNLPKTITTDAKVVPLFDLAIFQDLDSSHSPQASVEALRQELAKTTAVQFELLEANHGLVKTEFLYRSTDTERDFQVDVRYLLYSSGIADVEVIIRPTTSSELPSLTVAKKLLTSDGETGAIRQEGAIVPLKHDAPSLSGAAKWLAWKNGDGEVSRAILTNHFEMKERVLTGKKNATMFARINNINTNSAAKPVHLRYRFLPEGSGSLEELDQAMIAFAGHQKQERTDEEFHVSFGVGGVQFGVTLPYDTSWQENREKAQAQIQRDMRIANALGVDLIRIQGLTLPSSDGNGLETDEGRATLDYLEFVTTTARESGLKLLLHLQAGPSDAAQIAERFGNVISFFEIEPQETANDNRFTDEVREAIRAAQPEASVFVKDDRFASDFDAVARHVSIDAGYAADPAKDLALDLGGHAVRSGQTALISSFAPRTSTRKSEQVQANELFHAYEHLLSQRSVPYVIHAGFAESPEAAVDGVSLVRPDGTPTVKAHAFHEIIRRHSGSDNRIQTLDIRMPIASFRPGQTTTIPVEFKNPGTRPLDIETRLLLPEGLSLAENSRTALTLNPRESRTVERIIAADESLAPGFHHLFEEARYEETVRHGWTYGARRSTPTLELTREPATGVQYAGGIESLENINLSNVRHLAFDPEAPETEIIGAIQLGHSLRRATGTDILGWPAHQFGNAEQTRSHVLVGTPDQHPLIADLAGQLPIDPMDLAEGEGIVMVMDHPTEIRRFLLIVTGRDSTGVEKATRDLIGRIPNGSNRAR